MTKQKDSEQSGRQNNPNFVAPKDRPVAPGLSANFGPDQAVATEDGVTVNNEIKVRVVRQILK